MAMKRRIAESSMIRSMGYDPKTKSLEIEFIHGVVWQYFEVPEKVWDEFTKADSMGRFWHGYIKDEYEEMRVR